MISGRCAACKYLRRRCSSDCVFSPYFPPNDPQRFACVHRIYGASNVAKMLQDVPPALRNQAADTLCFEAKCRSEDQIYGCVGIISQLHQQLVSAEIELARIQAEIAFLARNAQESQVQAMEADFNFNCPLPEQVSPFGPSSYSPPSPHSSWFN